LHNYPNALRKLERLDGQIHDEELVVEEASHREGAAM
jgi:hypothetical protein